MHHAGEIEFILSRNKKLKFSETNLIREKLSEILQRDDFVNVKKWKITDSKIDPELFQRLPEAFEALSLNLVTDLDGNTIKSEFLEHALSPLKSQNQDIHDSEITNVQELKELYPQNNQITDEGFIQIVVNQELEVLDLRANQAGSFPDTTLIRPGRSKN